MLYNAEYRITMKDQKLNYIFFDDRPQDPFKLHTFTALFHTSYPIDIITFTHVLSLDVSHVISIYLLFSSTFELYLYAFNHDDGVMSSFLSTTSSLSSIVILSSL